MAEIIRGTTPTITFTFDSIDVSDIEVAYLTIRQSGADLVEKSIDSATVDAETNKVSWTLEQEDTLALSATNARAVVICDWRLFDGTRGRSAIASYNVSDTGIDEEI